MKQWDARAWIGLGLAAWAVASAAAPVRTDHVVAELVAERSAVQAGQVLQIGLSLTHQPGWHTYWRNPGDSGLPTRLTWQLPVGSQTSDIEWPVPQRLPVGPLVNYGYEGELLLPLSFTPPPSAKPGDTLTLKAQAHWLVCKDVCIPESAELELQLPVVGQDVTPGATAASPAFASNAAAVPLPLQGWSVELQHAGREALLLMKRTGNKNLGDKVLPSVHVFPYSLQLLEPARHEVYRIPQGYAVKLGVMADANLPKTVRGIAVAPPATPGEMSVWGMGSAAAEFTANVKAVPQLMTLSESDHLPDLPIHASSSLSQPANLATLSLWAALGLALVGGMVLNLMPCVFPVLSIKLLSLARTQDRQTLVTHALAYSVGVVLSFVALAAGLLALREAGSAVGWGFQLQEPGVVFALALLFFLLGLNLLGAFEFANVTPQALANWRDRRPSVDAFASGVLAVVAASPCTAPFMGAALGFALTQSTGVSLAVFAALGVGMALPYVLLTLAPGWRERLPRPGMWMVRLKQALAFPMFATVVWLLWVLGQQAGIDGASKVLLTLVGVAWVVWMVAAPAGWGVNHWVRRTLLAGAFVGVVVWGWPNDVPASRQADAGPAGAAVAGADWKTFDEASVADHLARGETVFIDFTAAWCVTCQVNKRLVLQSAETVQNFADAKVVLMRADWTDRNPQITAALARLGRNGVPVYVLLRPGKDPVLLPEVLTSGRVRDALRGL
ncbi:MAG: protein-disulfide reductase DsbD domain-containing protein [Pseudomonadota bacterium]